MLNEQEQERLEAVVRQTNVSVAELAQNHSNHLAFDKLMLTSITMFDTNIGRFFYGRVDRITENPRWFIDHLTVYGPMVSAVSTVQAISSIYFFPVREIALGEEVGNPMDLPRSNTSVATYFVDRDFVADSMSATTSAAPTRSPIYLPQEIRAEELLNTDPEMGTFGPEFANHILEEHDEPESRDQATKMLGDLIDGVLSHLITEHKNVNITALAFVAATALLITLGIIDSFEGTNEGGPLNGLSEEKVDKLMDSAFAHIKENAYMAGGIR